MKDVKPPSRSELMPSVEDAWRSFSRTVFADGELDRKSKELIAVAVAHVTQCPDCIKAHTRAAERAGASSKEIMEATWVAAEMRAGAAVAHSRLMRGELQSNESEGAANET